MNERMQSAADAMDASREARALTEKLTKAKSKEDLAWIEDAAFFFAAKWPAHRERFLQIAAGATNKHLSPNATGRKPEYDAAEDARVYNLYQGQPVRISVERFREENNEIKKAYTLLELRRLIDRERKRRAVAIKKRRRGKSCQ
jgi:hypothetical protein